MARFIVLSSIPSDVRLRFHLILTELGHIADRQWLCVTLIGLVAFAGSAFVGLLVGICEPKFHDEFSYLLAADTFIEFPVIMRKPWKFVLVILEIEAPRLKFGVFSNVTARGFDNSSVTDQNSPVFQHA
jgi:hypothetical protein